MFNQTYNKLTRNCNCKYNNLYNKRSLISYNQLYNQIEIVKIRKLYQTYTDFV